MTTTNRPPSTYSQADGIVFVNQLLPPATMQAPTMAPISDPRPPTATQIAISIEFAGCISLGLMIPTCGT